MIPSGSASEGNMVNGLPIQKKKKKKKGAAPRFACLAQHLLCRLNTSFHGDLRQRCEGLMGRSHPNLAPHLGHGAIDGMPFLVAP